MKCKLSLFTSLSMYFEREMSHEPGGEVRDVKWEIVYAGREIPKMNVHASRIFTVLGFLGYFCAILGYMDKQRHS